MTDQDVRWLQRLQNFRKAFSQLDDAVALMSERELSGLEKQGVIHTFEYSYELAWNLLRDYLKWQGTTHLPGSRDTIREAFSAGLITEGEQWMAIMLQGRNHTSHTDNEETEEAILKSIQQSYHGLFVSLEQALAGEARRHGYR